MKKLICLTILSLSATLALSHAAMAAGSHVHGNVNITTPITLTSTGDYRVAGDLTTSSPFTDTGTGSVVVGHNLYVKAPFVMTGTGDVVVNGDLVISNKFAFTGTGNVIVKGKIYIIKGQGEFAATGTGRVEAQPALYVDSYMPNTVVEQTKIIPAHAPASSAVITVSGRPATSEEYTNNPSPGAALDAGLKNAGNGLTNAGASINTTVGR